MKETPAALSGVFNNNVVRLLKSGTADAVKKLVAFGCRPEMSLDLVEGKSERHTFWGWSHSAPLADGASAWWYWIDRFVGQMPPAAARKHLDWAFGEAMEVAFEHGRVLPLVSTWGNLLAHAGKGATPGWTREVMVTRFLVHLARGVGPGASFLEAFTHARLLGPGDCSQSSRARCPLDPLGQAICRGDFALVDAFLSAGSGTRLASGDCGLVLAWSLLPLLPGAPQRDQPMAPGVVSAANTVAVLLEGGADWSVRLADGGSVRSHAVAERPGFSHPALARLARAIDAREIDVLMKPSSAPSARRRL